ncbi:unnamed protein product [Brassicogethes aeneus]|uniref:Small ribosomal subunit protein uS10 domain-containing protein n=1 Tax=Brassicogethes aeneus TaxID=1431903 RepID=A0A9P0BB23_BRAAE|nr:unnamed protein product [Brassicogethes aeneus]
MNFLQKFTPKITRLIKFQYVNPFSSGSLYEPDYLEGMKSKVPLYDTLNIELRGYDYPILESYQKYLNKLITNMDITVEDAWATPAQDLQLTTYKPNSELVNTQYKLRKYHRTLQITDISSLQLPMLLRVLESSTPPGVTIKVLPHEDDHEEVRYVPDSELLQLKHELDELGGPSKKK